VINTHEINDKQLLADIYRSTRPHHMLSDAIQHFKYNITAKDGMFFIETEEENAKELSHLLAGEFLIYRLIQLN
jgi:hypothetical protein